MTSWKIPAVFYYSSTRMILAALTALTVTIWLGPRCILLLYNLKTGQSIRVEDCPMLASLHEKKKHTPSMGGVLILFSILLSLLLWMDLKSSFTLILAVATLWLGLIGGFDDYLKMKYKNSKGLKGKLKFLLQITFAILFAVYLLVPSCTEALHIGTWFSPPVAKEQLTGGHSITLTTQAYQGMYFFPFKKQCFLLLSGGSLILSALFILFVVTGSSNAVNLSDGLDGLASGLILMVAAILAIFAFLSNHMECARYLNVLYIEGSGEIAVFLFAVFGATLGFLWYNAHPAQVFMGDVGSIPLGGILGVCAVLLRREFLLALVGAVFVMEALSVMIQVTSYKLRKGKRVFLCSPIHHHFEYKGWPETKIVIRFWIVGLILALIGLASLKFQ
jgi:phospho-N-acetylmuramoyl-pentapeptide-transferase